MILESAPLSAETGWECPDHVLAPDPYPSHVIFSM